jgi:hypothetical protein
MFTAAMQVGLQQAARLSLLLAECFLSSFACYLLLQ